MNYQKLYTKYCFTAEQIPLLEEFFNKKFDDIIKELDSTPWDECVKKIQLASFILRMKNNA